jgi:putative membrane-bound dehydrogenase-like protein
MPLRSLPKSLAAACLTFVASLLILPPACMASDDVDSPLSPDEAQKSFRLADDALRIELAAAEPDVVDPIAIRFDEDGRMWVVEMRDYPLGPPAGGRPLSRIRVLEDKNGDGRFETATTFADGLSFVTGLQPWNGGVFVTLSGAVVYMKDTTGDGRADFDETWYEGFAEQNSQLRANHPRLALDNWIYVANGLRGGKVFNRKLKDQSPIDISGMDFRFDPLTGKAEAVSGNGQFGLCFDDWGNRFNCSNRNPVRHVVIEDRYLKASPGVTVPTVMHDVAAHGEASRIFPISRAWTTSNLHAGQFTAACGVYIYRGDVLPAEYRGNVFTCEPTGNLIHREIIEPAGPTFTSQPAYSDKDFLASPDEWFRPVNMELGPDGALYVVDMYRCVIEHPDWVPDELKRRPDTRFGDDRGRIWRIVPADNTNPTRQRAVPLSNATAEDLARLLEHPNAWQRETAQRLLLQRQWSGIAPKLQDLAASSQLAQGRLHAIWTLQGIGCLAPDNIRRALEDTTPLVRRQAVTLAELTPHVGDRLRAKAIQDIHFDSDAGVRFQAMLNSSLTSELADEEWELERAERMAVRARRDADDPWLRAAMRMHLGPRESLPLVRRLLSEKGARPPSAGEIMLVRELAESWRPDQDGNVVSGIVQAAVAALEQPYGVQNAVAALNALARAMARQRSSLEQLAEPAALSALQSKLEALIASKSPAVVVPEAISLIAYLPNSGDVLVTLSRQDEDQSIRVAAISALARLGGGRGWKDLLEAFAAETPAIRRAIVDGLLANTERTNLLLDAIEAGRLKPSELDVSHVNRLTGHRDATIKQRAGKLLAAATPQDRAQALADYQPVLQMNGDAKRGQVVFEKNCAACHRIGEVGVNVAPDISDSRTKTAAQLLTDIVQPNRAIDNNYLGYTVRLADGIIETGILTAETATSITLRQQGGKEVVIPRSEIDELKSTGVSLMPEGLERQIPPQDMADLIAFVKHWRYLDGRTPLSPEVGAAR